MRLVIRPSESDAAEWAALYVKQRITSFAPTQEKPFVLGLCTGTTMLGMYKRLVEIHKSGSLSFQHVITFSMDEYVGLGAQHPQSYHHYMWEQLYRHVDIRPENVHILDGNAPELDEECRRYEEKITTHGGVELFIGGTGPDGHIGFNEPGSSLNSRTRVKTLAHATVTDMLPLFDNDINKVPKMACTIGVGTFMDSQEVLVIMTSTRKAKALSSCIEDGVSHMSPITVIQNHKRAVVVCDDDATLDLRVRTVRYFKGLEEVHNEMLGPMNGIGNVGILLGAGICSPACMGPSESKRKTPGECDEDQSSKCSRS